jgi:YaiO family outer membrane protein
MNHRRFLRSLTLLLLMSIALAWRANAQKAVAFSDPKQSSPQTPGADVPVTPTPEKILTNFVEVGGSYRQLTNGFGDWSGGYARGVLATGKNVWNAEANGQHEFGDGGVYLAAGDTYNFNSDWYASLTLGSSVGGFFWPRFRADAFVNRKWGGRKQFITTLGYGYYASKDVHRDQSVFIGTNYYFRGPWIVEDGVRFNVSNPGVVFSPAGFVAVTEGRNKHHYVTVNAGFGQEAYQIVGPSTVLTRFPSQNMTITWRQWMGKNWGFNLVGEYYHSPFYERGGGSFGFFKEF